MEKLFRIEQYKTEKLRTKCDSINRQNTATQLKLQNILSLISNEQPLNEISRVQLASECADYINKLYAIMNYSTSVMSEILSTRGSGYGDNFHDLVKKTLKNPTGYSNSTMTIISSVVPWYPIVHDMRSEEAHFSMGIITLESGRYFYSIDRNSLRKSMYDLLREFNLSEAGDFMPYKF